VADDPDAPGGEFTHWIIANVPGDALSVPEAAEIPGTTVGLNGFGQAGYGGPCPPRMEIHHYRFIVFALDTKLEVPPAAPRETVDTAMSGHVLAAGTLVGTFSH
jgi:Raf kinase inhibitor-like YbhB/YbcL family protein